MERWPIGTPYAGPIASYDDQVTMPQFMARMVYGQPPDLLPKGQRMDLVFFGRLFDQLANSHAALVRDCPRPIEAYRLAMKLHAELRHIKHFRPATTQGRFVMVYNDFLPDTPVYVPRGWNVHAPDMPYAEWCTLAEAARLLNITKTHTRNLIDKMGIETPRRGGTLTRYIHRADVARLANRPGKYEKRPAWAKVAQAALDKGHR